MRGGDQRDALGSCPGCSAGNRGKPTCWRMTSGTADQSCLLNRRRRRLENRTGGRAQPLHDGPGRRPFQQSCHDPALKRGLADVSPGRYGLGRAVPVTAAIRRPAPASDWVLVQHRRFLYGPGCQDLSWLGAEKVGLGSRSWSVGDGGRGAQRFLGARRARCRRRQQCGLGDPQREPRSRQCYKAVQHECWRACRWQELSAETLMCDVGGPGRRCRLR